MKTLLLEGTLTALTSISHIGETHGIRAMLRREKVIQPDGRVEEVPIISGNSIRGILRDRGMLHLVQALGYGTNTETGQVTGLSLAAFYFLFSGGTLTSTGAEGINVTEARRWRDLIPLVALFGGAMGNQIMPGKAKIGKAIPICAETTHLIPERFRGGTASVSIWDLCQEEAYTRRDDEKSERLRQLIAPPVRALLEAKASAQAEKRGTDDDVRGQEQKQQMRYFCETLAAGTRLFWEVVLEDVTELEMDAFCVTLAEFGRFPYLGGKSSVGLGKVALQFDDWCSVSTSLTPVGTEVGAPLGALYQAHLAKNGSQIRELLDGFA